MRSLPRTRPSSRPIARCCGQPSWLQTAPHRPPCRFHRAWCGRPETLATPMLAPMTTVRSAKPIGSFRFLIIRAQVESTADMSRGCARTKPNSSPPSRATRSVSRINVRKRPRLPRVLRHGIVPDGVIDTLEAVQIDEQQCKVALTTLGSRNKPAQIVVEHSAIRQSREKRRYTPFFPDIPGCAAIAQCAPRRCFRVLSGDGPTTSCALAQDRRSTIAL